MPGTIRASRVLSMTASQLKKQLETQLIKDPFCTSVTLIEVRNRSEIEKTGKIKGSINIPLPSLVEETHRLLADIPKDRKVVFQCASGRRSHIAATKAIESGFTNVYNLEGGFSEWQKAYPVQSFQNNHSPTVHTILDEATDTAQYIVTDEETRETVIIDPVLDYDAFAGTVRAETAKNIIAYVKKNELDVTRIIDTHVHADHLTAASFLHAHLPRKPPVSIGSHVSKVQSVFRKKYNMAASQLSITGEQYFDFVHDNMEWRLGKNIHCKAFSTPGHTPACMSWLIGDALFVGDTLFMPDIGTARCDFPGGSAEDMYNSIHHLYKILPDDTRTFVGHDYPQGRKHMFVTLLEAHKRHNKMIRENTSLEEYVKLRKERDDQLKAPRYLHPSLQTNLRGGDLPTVEYRDGTEAAGQFFKVPVRFVE
ncbi:hypothetical protein NQZ79_g1396 [Umbelopsis isabellina]|nr:hypothetical protein NQZ79_g1396 [Umbelopsis isabellina]